MKEYTKRQIEIMEAAATIISKHGIQNLTIKTLAEDIGFSEPALYRHFSSKNEILLSLLSYFKGEMKSRIQSLSLQQEENQSTQLKAVFNSQFQAFAKKPAIISVIFAEGIFHYDEKLSKEVAEIMDFMQEYVTKNITKGQKKGQYSKMIDASTLATIIIGGMRMTILKWKLSGYTSNLTKEGNMVLESTLKMFETNKL